MKKIIIALLILAASITSSYAGSVRNIQDNYQVVYTVLNTTGASVSGQTVTVKIEKVSNGAWYDFSDDTFKASGWTAKNTALTEDATEGMYSYTFNPPASETTADQYIILIENTNTTYADHQAEVVSYQDAANGTQVQSIYNFTDNTKHGGDYQGISKAIRVHQ